MPQPDARDSDDRRLVRRQILQCGATALGDPGRLVDHRPGVTHQFDLIRAQFNADPDGMKQRTPFGLLAAAMADIVLSVGHSARDRRNLHHARIGAATAIKENPQASVRTRSHKAYASAGSTAHSPRHCR